MSDHEGALQAALIGWLRDDAALDVLLGGRIWDQPPAEHDWPWLQIGPSQSRPLGADGGGQEHRLGLTCVSRFGGSEEARAVNAAVRARLAAGRPEPEGVRIVSLATTMTETFRSPDLRRTYGVVRLRVVTEDN